MQYCAFLWAYGTIHQAQEFMFRTNVDNSQIYTCKIDDKYQVFVCLAVKMIESVYLSM